MTTTTAGTGPVPDVVPDHLRRTARTTGLLYLAFFVAGVAGTLFVRGQLFVDDDPLGTLDNLTAHETLARVGIALELAIVLVQALTAVWFYRLFRQVDSLAAGALAAFGLVNAVAILGSAAVLATALDVARDGSLAAAATQAGTVQLLYLASGHLWSVASVFFGLWLVPMGRLATRSQWFPRLLGPLLVVAGVCYLVSAFTGYLFADSDIATQLLTLPSIVGEVWITGYLLVVGVRRHAPAGERLRGRPAPSRA